jgi:hypothetical protein
MYHLRKRAEAVAFQRHLRKECSAMIARTEQLEENNYDGQDSQDMETRIGQPSRTSWSRQDSHKKKSTKVNILKADILSVIGQDGVL